MQVNGAAARLVHTGDTVIVVSYASYDEADLEAYEPRVVHVDEHNEIVTLDSDAKHLAAPTGGQNLSLPNASSDTRHLNPVAEVLS
jgi:aspartate 1-decarboxylase